MDRAPNPMGPHRWPMVWNDADQLQEVDLGGGGRAYYVYDGAGQRVRKLILRQNGTEVVEHIYLGGRELYRRHMTSNGAANAVASPSFGGMDLGEAIETVHVMDDERRVALVETKTTQARLEVRAPAARARYQLEDHLGTSTVELTDAEEVISYEEFYPYGAVAYSARSTTAGLDLSPRRYRYTTKERDEETGLDYFGARYYLPWLGRWLSADPAGFVDGPNLYQYVRGLPIGLWDPTGMATPMTDATTTSTTPRTRGEMSAKEEWEEAVAPHKSGAPISIIKAIDLIRGIEETTQASPDEVLSFLRAIGNYDDEKWQRLLVREEFDVDPIADQLDAKTVGELIRSLRHNSEPGTPEHGVVVARSGEKIALGHVITGIAAGLARNLGGDPRPLVGRMVGAGTPGDPLYIATISGDLGQVVARVKTGVQMPPMIGYHGDATRAEILGDIDGFVLGSSQSPGELATPVSVVLSNYYLRDAPGILVANPTVHTSTTAFTERATALESEVNAFAETYVYSISTSQGLSGGMKSWSRAAVRELQRLLPTRRRTPRGER